jgi:NADH-quinone oxidoreductase subunit H
MPEFRFIPVALTIGITLFVVLHVVAYMILVERKVSAWMQDRIGPNRVGPFGLLQPIVDGAKMIFKEDILPSHVDRVFYVLGPAIAACTALLAFAVVPFGPTTAPPAPSDSVNGYIESQSAYRDHFQFAIAPGLDIGMLWTFAISSLAVYGIILGGWSSNSKYSLLGALRSSAQIISYEIPLGLSVIGVVLMAGSLNLEAIIEFQAQNGWNVLFQPVAFLIFLTSVFAECNRLPFDLPEAEQELVGGYHTEYSSIKFGLYFLGEYTHMITTSFLVAILFFGGWHLPFGLTHGEGVLSTGLKMLAILGKSGFFLVFYVLVRWTIPRFRFDQLMGLAWKGLIPLSLAQLIGVMIVKEFAISQMYLLVVAVGIVAAMGSMLAKRQKPSMPQSHLAA